MRRLLPWAQRSTCSPTVARPNLRTPGALCFFRPSTFDLDPCQLIAATCFALFLFFYKKRVYTIAKWPRVNKSKNMFFVRGPFEQFSLFSYFESQNNFVHSVNHSRALLFILVFSFIFEQISLFWSFGVRNGFYLLVWSEFVFVFVKIKDINFTFQIEFVNNSRKNCHWEYVIWHFNLPININSTRTDQLEKLVA